jgi:hypothetical protein
VWLDKKQALIIKEIEMPFKSKAQARYMFAKEPEVAKEFASKTKSIKSLPEKVKKKKKK